VSVNPISAYGAGKIAGAVEECERIIKLLEADCKHGIGEFDMGCPHEVAIALINRLKNPVVKEAFEGDIN
jgi:hypothetical protein